jgi:O-antigen/teichoic acid export membrane protein
MFKQLFKQTAIYGISSILSRLLNYLLVPLHTYVLNPDAYGSITEFYAYVTFLIIIYTFGMETAFFRFSEKEPTEKVQHNAILFLASTSVLFSALLWFFAPELSNLIGYGSQASYVKIFALILGLDALTSIPFVSLRKQNRAFRFVFARLMSIGVNIVFNIYWLIACPWLESVGLHQYVFFYAPNQEVYLIFLSNLIGSLSVFLFFLPYFKIKFSSFNPKLLKQMLLYATPLLFAGLAGMVNESFSRVQLKNLLPFSDQENMYQLGVFGACYKLSIFMALAIQAFRMAAEPFIFQQFKHQDSKLIYARLMDYFVFACLIIFVIIAFQIDVVKVLIDPQYHQGLTIVPILLLANMLLGVYYNLSIWYKLNDKTIYGTWFYPNLGFYGSSMGNLNLLCNYGCGVLYCWTKAICHSL